jgi:eukaryotic-like serine/threonine-protein kinase
MSEAEAPIGGKYRLLRLIATGGMGSVHEAIHEKTHGRVAIKILSDSAKKDEGSRARFAREARASGRLRSRHVARVIDVDELADGTPYLVMEYLEGQDLSQLVKARGALPLPEVASILIQACAGVAEAHANGIVHRDLKPGNIFLAEEGASHIAKVLDFGISKAPSEGDAEELTRTFSTVGTPGYMSPEQIRSPKDVDAATDVWAMGVMLYRLLTATLPFSGNASSIAVAICHEPPAPIARPLPDDVKALLDSALNKDRSKRPTIRDFAEVLAAHLDSDAAIAREALAELTRLDAPRRPPAPIVQAEPTFAATAHLPTEPSRSRWPFVAGGILVVAAVAFAATRKQAPPPTPAPTVVAAPPEPIVVLPPTAPSPSISVSVAPTVVPKPSAIVRPKTKPSANVSIPPRL